MFLCVMTGQSKPGNKKVFVSCYPAASEVGSVDAFCCIACCQALWVPFPAPISCLMHPIARCISGS